MPIFYPDTVRPMPYLREEPAWATRLRGLLSYASVRANSEQMYAAMRRDFPE